MGFKMEYYGKSLAPGRAIFAANKRLQSFLGDGENSNIHLFPSCSEHCGTFLAPAACFLLGANASQSFCWAQTPLTVWLVIDEKKEMPPCPLAVMDV